MIPQDTLNTLKKWRWDTEDFAACCVKILTKSGKIVPLVLNEAQQTLMKSCDVQLERIGRVRKVLVKGRQQGASTCIAARFYRDAMLKPGTRVLVVAHRQDATKNLSEMTRRMHDHMEPALQVPTVARNDTSLKFVHESSYTLQTAGQSADPGKAGRSRTSNRLHASEFAFWGGAGDAMAGLGQTIADEPGSEAIIESTAQGQSNALYDIWRLAESGVSDWEPLFIPWFVEKSYTREPPSGWKPSREDEWEGVPSEYDYQQMYDLKKSQVYWRRLKIGELSLGVEDGIVRWQQEYPASAMEAFVSSSQASYISAIIIAAARNRRIEIQHVAMMPLVVGCDPATSHGTNETCIMRRRGKKQYGMERYLRLSPDEIKVMLWKIWQDEKPEVIVVDRGGPSGDHVYMGLLQMGVNVIGVFFGGRPDDKRLFADKRAELYTRYNAWLPDADIPDDPELAKDLLAQERKPDEKQQIRLKSKPDLALKSGQSPDRSDAGALTMEFIDPEAGAMDWGQAKADPFKRRETLTRAGVF